MSATRSLHHAKICRKSISPALAASVVRGGDGGLDLIPAGALNGRRRLQDAHALGDLAGAPQAAVLPVERDDATL